MNTHIMNTNLFDGVDRLSNRQLVVQIKQLAQGERDATASLIAHLTVLDERGLYRAEGCSSTFTYCLEVLHLSEHAAYGRIAAARAARKYPLILELLASGSINLTTVTLLARHLTPENHAGLLEAAKHQRKQQVEELVAQVRPLPPVPSSIRKLPAPQHAPASPPIASAPQWESEILPADLGDSGDAGADVPVLTLEAPVRPAVVAPLAPERYKVQFTASAEIHEKLQMAQELLRHQIPEGDIGQIIDRALTALLKELKRQKFASTEHPRTSNLATKDHATFGNHGTAGDHNTAGDHSTTGAHDTADRSRHIPAEVRRQVWARDGGRCGFIAHNGRRCTERGFLEFHHVVPYGAGGVATADNIQLRCRAHNGLEAELFFGQRGDGVRISTRSGPSWSGTRGKTRSRAMRAITSFR